jgi:hypothetical protein
MSFPKINLNEEEIKSMMRKIKQGKGLGLDGIHSKIFKIIKTSK